MPLITRNLAAKLLALPAVMVPTIEIPLVLWARSSFLGLHPDYLENPPTISRSISDPVVGPPFASMILLITALILFLVVLLFWAYLLAISRLALGRMQRLVFHGLLALTIMFQVVASAGMVTTTQVTFLIDHDIHMIGSYVFFAFQALTILLASMLCLLLFKEYQLQTIADHEWQFQPRMHLLRYRFGLVTMSLVVLYGVLFVLKDHALPISGYAVQVIYTQCEVVVIACFVLFLGSYAVDIHHMVKHDRLYLRRRTEGAVVPAAGES